MLEVPKNIHSLLLRMIQLPICIREESPEKKSTIKRKRRRDVRCIRQVTKKVEVTAIENRRRRGGASTNISTNGVKGDTLVKTRDIETTDHHADPDLNLAHPGQGQGPHHHLLVHRIEDANSIAGRRRERGIRNTAEEDTVATKKIVTIMHIQLKPAEEEIFFEKI